MWMGEILGHRRSWIVFEKQGKPGRFEQGCDKWKSFYKKLVYFLVGNIYFLSHRIRKL